MLGPDVCQESDAQEGPSMTETDHTLGRRAAAHDQAPSRIVEHGVRAQLIDVLVRWPVSYIFVVLVQIPGTKNGHAWALESMKSRFGPTKVEEKTMPNTISTLPGPGLGTKRPKRI